MKFVDLAEGDTFKYNGIIYRKTAPQKVSCCKVLNAVNVINNQKIMIKPLTVEVEKVEV